MQRISFSALLLALLLTACAHTNKLAQYPLTGRTALFRTTLASDAAASIAVIEPPNDNTAVGVVTAIGSIIVSNESKHKLERAIVGDTIANSVARGVREATADYLSLRPVNDISQNPDVLVETELTDCKVFSGSTGLAIRVRGNARLIDRHTGVVVWENAESHTVPISETYLSLLGPRGIRTGTSIFNAVQLLALSEEEIRLVVNAAARDAGREIGETLREDVADLHK